MLVIEYVKNLIHTYSDAGYFIRQVETGIDYVEAYDRVAHEYIETDIPIPEEEPEELDGEVELNPVDEEG